MRWPLWFRRCCRDGHRWTPWVIDPKTKRAIRHCLFCKATCREHMA